MTGICIACLGVLQDSFIENIINDVSSWYLLIFNNYIESHGEENSAISLNENVLILISGIERNPKLKIRLNTFYHSFRPSRVLSFAKPLS